MWKLSQKPDPLVHDLSQRIDDGWVLVVFATGEGKGRDDLFDFIDRDDSVDSPGFSDDFPDHLTLDTKGENEVLVCNQKVEQGQSKAVDILLGGLEIGSGTHEGGEDVVAGRSGGEEVTGEVESDSA